MLVSLTSFQVFLLFRSFLVIRCRVMNFHMPLKSHCKSLSNGCQNVFPYHHILTNNIQITCQLCQSMYFIQMPGLQMLLKVTTQSFHSLYKVAKSRLQVTVIILFKHHPQITVFRLLVEVVYYPVIDPPSIHLAVSLTSMTSFIASLV